MTLGPQQQLHWGPEKTPQGHLPRGTNGCTRFWLSSHCRCKDATSWDPPSSYFQEGVGFPYVSTNSISFLFPHLFFARSSHKSTLKDGKSNRKMGKACRRSSLRDVRRVPQGFALLTANLRRAVHLASTRKPRPCSAGEGVGESGRFLPQLGLWGAGGPQRDVCVSQSPRP